MKYNKNFLSMALIASVLGLTACKDDAVPVSTVNFAIPAMEVDESNGTSSFHPLLYNGANGREIPVTIKLNRAVAETSIISFTTDGTATRNSTTDYVGDYDIVENDEYIIIEKGQNEATITIRLYEDYDFEVDNNNNLYETIIIGLNTVVTGSAVIGDDDVFTLTIYEDDTYVYLDWDDHSGDADPHGDVDMDLNLWLDQGSGYQYIGGSVYKDFSPEFISIPGGFPDGTYGLSYTYYAGTSDNLEVKVKMFNAGGLLGGVDQLKNYTGFYTLGNINLYDYNADPPSISIAQTMVKNGFNYPTISSITVNANGGSRLSGNNSLILNELKGLTTLRKPNRHQVEWLINKMK